MQEHIKGPYSEILQKHKNNTTQEEKPKKRKKKMTYYVMTYQQEIADKRRDTYYWRVLFMCVCSWRLPACCDLVRRQTRKR